ncbi:MAG: hypothetical protein U0930_09695 [Pirellulales bacterium]
MKIAVVVIATIAIVGMLAASPSSRLFLMGASQYHLKSGNWVNIGPRGRISVDRFESIVDAVNARGDVDCLRLSNPTISNAAFIHVQRLRGLSMLYIEDATISDDALVNIRPLKNLYRIHIDRCPNLSMSAIDALRRDLPSCEISVDSYTFPSSNKMTGSSHPDEHIKD